MAGWTVLIAAHAIGATVALMLGAYVVLRRRKGDRLHRRLGMIWVGTMYWVALSSFGIQELSPGHFTWIHGLSLWTIVSLTVAVWAAMNHRVALHRQFVVGSYLGVVGAGLASMAFPVRLIPQTVIHQPALFVAVVAATAAMTAVLVRVVSVATGRVGATDAAVRRETAKAGARPGDATAMGDADVPALVVPG